MGDIKFAIYVCLSDLLRRLEQRHGADMDHVVPALYGMV